MRVCRWLLVFAAASFACSDGDSDVLELDAGAPGLDAGPDGGVDDAAVPRPPRRTVSVMTWNLREYPLTDQTEAKVVEILEGLDADVVGIQEISDPAAFDALVAALPSYDGFSADVPNAFLRVGILVRSARVEVSDVRLMFEEFRFGFPRPPLAAHMSVKDEIGDPLFDFTFVVVHLKARVDDESRMRRLAGIDALEDWAHTTLATQDEQDIVIVGDYNDELDDRRDENVFSAFLDSPEAYTFLSAPLVDAGAFSYLPFSSMIDHILTSSSALEEYGAGQTEVLRLDLMVDSYEDQVSDHLPVLSTFRP